MKWNDLTEEQQEFLLELDKNYPMPDGATHFDMDDRTRSFWLKLEQGDWWYHSRIYCGAWYPTSLLEDAFIVEIPDKPWYVPEDVAFNQGETMLGRWFKVVDNESPLYKSVGECVDQDFSEIDLKISGKGVYTFDKGDLVQMESSQVDETYLTKQEGGTHYKKCSIQPIEYIHANGLDYFQGNVVKYVTRHKDKNGKQDILKAIHYLEMILEMQYKEVE